MELHSLIEKLKQDTNSDRVAIWVRAYDNYKYLLKPFYLEGVEEGQLNSDFLKIKLIDNDGNGQLVFDTLKLGKPMVLNGKSQEFINKIEGRLKYDVRSTMLVPIKACNTIVGVVQFFNSANGKYTYADTKKVDIDDISKVIVNECQFIDWDGDTEVALTLFTMKAEYELKTIWQFINMLSTIDEFEDTKEGRDLYRENIFEVYNVKITSYISRFESNLHRLNSIATGKLKQISKYLESTYGAPKESTLEKLNEKYEDITISYDMLVRDVDALKIYLDDYIEEDCNEKEAIIDIASSVDNIIEFYQKTKSALNIIRVDVIDNMLNDMGDEPFVDEFLGIVDDDSEMASNVAIQSKIEESLKQLIKFKKIMSGISYFGNNAGFAYFKRELTYFRDLFEIFKEEKFEHFFYNGKEHDIDIHVDIINNRIIKTDAFKLELALEAIFNNAAEELALKDTVAPDCYKKIDITIDSDEENAYFKIKDNGRGIMPELQSHIFNKYETFGKQTGAGIGLTIAKDVVENGLWGEISFTSDEANGTEFIITLPI
jgi:signal transduction histidine kinase